MSDLCPPLIPSGIERIDGGCTRGTTFACTARTIMEKNSLPLSLSLSLCLVFFVFFLSFFLSLFPSRIDATSIFAKERLSITDGLMALKLSIASDSTFRGSHRIFFANRFTSLEMQVQGTQNIN